jgi:cytidylate kinase
VDPEEIADEERRKSFATRVLQAMGQGSGEAWALTATTRGTSDEPSSDDLRAVIRQTIEQIAGRGMTVIVSHAASHVVAPGPDALRVFVTASRATREARLREEEGLDREGAARAVKDSDAGRRDYLKRFYEADDELPTHYDLVVNTDVVSVERAAQLVSDAASS